MTGAPPPSGLEGHHFLSYVWGQTPRVVEWQGRVISEVGHGYWLVQLYEWLGGTESMRRICHVTEMARWTFYRTAEEMRSDYEHYSRQRDQATP